LGSATSGNTLNSRSHRRARRPLLGLRAARETLGLTQQEMATQLDMTKAHYGKFELGLVDMYYQDAKRAAKIVDIAMEDLE